MIYTIVNDGIIVSAHSTLELAEEEVAVRLNFYDDIQEVELDTKTQVPEGYVKGPLYRIVYDKYSGVFYSAHIDTRNRQYYRHPSECRIVDLSSCKVIYSPISFEHAIEEGKKLI